MRDAGYEIRVAGCKSAMRDARYEIRAFNPGSRIPDRLSRIPHHVSRISAKWTGAIHGVNDMSGRYIIFS